MEIEHIKSVEEFNNVIKKDKIVLVDFFATWCGPCKMLGPVLEQVSNEAENTAKIYKLDIDECMDSAKEYGVMSVPTMIIFKDGKEVDRIVGLRQKTQILEALKKSN